MAYLTWIILFPHPSNIVEFAISLQRCLRDPWDTSCSWQCKEIQRTGSCSTKTSHSHVCFGEPYQWDRWASGTCSPGAAGLSIRPVNPRRSSRGAAVGWFAEDGAAGIYLLCSKEAFFVIFTSGMKTVNKPFTEPAVALSHSHLFSVKLLFLLCVRRREAARMTQEWPMFLPGVPFLPLPAETGLELFVLSWRDHLGTVSTTYNFYPLDGTEGPWPELTLDLLLPYNSIIH